MTRRPTRRSGYRGTPAFRASRHDRTSRLRACVAALNVAEERGMVGSLPKSCQAGCIRGRCRGPRDEMSRPPADHVPLVCSVAPREESPGERRTGSCGERRSIAWIKGADPGAIVEVAMNAASWSCAVGCVALVVTAVSPHWSARRDLDGRRPTLAAAHAWEDLSWRGQRATSVRLTAAASRYLR
jgi:hypothetical protein